ncbi:MAG: glutamate--tRNA ligase [Alphaproteobacteria bacterium]|jgi:glutamyl-tRNA synthetase|nr:glutamate--tRNA ligase [Alphaproteobacteria bacterium]
MSSSARPVVTRIAPSPTGSMHIGTARTALFNWLYARHCGGKFLLRIEDTDRERSTEASVQVILDGLDWLGLHPDEPPTYQFARAARHREAVEALFAAGGAYRCYMTPEETAAERERARTEGRAIRSPWRDREAPGDDRPFTIRFRGPLEGETVVDDLVKGQVTFANRDLDDLVLLRSDGTPTYNLAVVVDDHDMGVTHVFRGDDHLSNAARQSLIYTAMGWDLPVFAHLPMIHGPDGAKLSKRHGAQAVGEFADLGYLPEAMRNYLARLGWGHGDDELFTDAQAISWFDIRDVVRSPARLDWNKLNHVNAHYIRLADAGRLADLVMDVLRRRGEAPGKTDRDRTLALIPLVKESAKTLIELADLTAFARLVRPLALDAKTISQLDGETRARLARLALALESVSDWTAEPLLAALRDFASGEGVGLGKFGAPLRGVLSAGYPAPDLASALAGLGREESLGRIADALR